MGSREHYSKTDARCCIINKPWCLLIHLQDGIKKNCDENKGNAKTACEVCYDRMSPYQFIRSIFNFPTSAYLFTDSNSNHSLVAKGSVLMFEQQRSFIGLLA